MPSRIDHSIYIGEQFGRWIVLGEERRQTGTGKKEPFAFCQCSCENKTRRFVRFSDLLNGSSVSCGCYQRERASECNVEENEYNLSGECGIGKLENGNAFLFDLEDYDIIKEYKWHRDKNGYVATFLKGNNNQKKLKLHRVILGLDECSKLVADHANHDKLDNRKSNIRIATHQQNTQNALIRKDNKSGFAGVFLDKRDGYYYYYIQGKLLGRSKDLNFAITQRLKAEKEYFGEFAPQRHLFEEYGI